MTCIVCFEIEDDSATISCHRGHILCSKDFNQYMKENILPKIYSLKNSCCRIPCADLTCNSFLDTVQSWYLLEKSERIRYFNIISLHLHEEDAFKSALYQQSKSMCLDIHKALTLRCKRCNNAVDCYADGCSAVQCLTCGTFFCNCCFENGFDLIDIERDRALAHAHVSSHHPAENVLERSAFLPNEVVREGQRKLLIKQLYSVLMDGIKKLLTSNKREDCEIVVTLALICAHSELQELGLEVRQVWTDAKKLLDAEYPEAGCAILNSHQIDTMLTHVVHVDAGSMLARAVVSSNAVAASQVLSTASRDGLDPNYFDPSSGYNILSLAILNGSMDIATRLFELGASPLLYNLNGRNAVYLAIEAHRWNVAAHFLEKCSSTRSIVNDPLTNEADHYAAIHVIARYGNPHMLHSLLAMGADINLREEEYGYTPLSLALIVKNEACASALISANCDIYAEHGNGRTALYTMAELGLTEILRLIINDRPDFAVNRVVDTSGMCLLHVAATYSQPYFLQMLLSVKAVDHLNAVTADGLSPLLCALLAGCERSACLLLDAGTRIDPYKDKPLAHHCIELGLLSVLQRLFAQRAVNATVEEAGTCLEVAVQCAQYHILDYLLSLQIEYDASVALRAACAIGDCWSIQRILLSQRVEQNALSACSAIAVHTGQNNDVLRLLAEYEYHTD